MLVVTISKLQFEYDIHSLVKAFYPEEEVKVILKEESPCFALRDLFLDLDLGSDQVIQQNRIVCTLKASMYHKESKSEVVVEQEESDRADMRNKLKQLIYELLSENCQHTLPWGTLTGIRPTKIPMMKLEEGKTREEILAFMKETYLISEEKAKLSFEIAEKELQILDGIHYKEGYSLYLGIPFCPTTCLYCSFTSYPIGLWKQKVEDYLDALDLEIEAVSELMKSRILDSVYIGGGTPTTLTEEQLERVLSKLTSRFDFSHVKEFTLEAGRADSITPLKLAIMKKYGVERISVNPQTMKEETLRMIGRGHTVDQVKIAFRQAREAGFENINMDLILGLPGETIDDVIITMEEIKKLNPDSLTVHSLAIKRASKLSEWIIKNGLETMKNTTETMEIASRAAHDIGMEPYYLYRQKNMAGNFENVGYAKPGRHGLYNILIMEEKQSIMALGAGSISKMVYVDGRIERADNVKDPKLYIEQIEEMIARKRKLLLDEKGELNGTQ